MQTLKTIFFVANIFAAFYCAGIVGAAIGIYTGHGQKIASLVPKEEVHRKLRFHIICVCIAILMGAAWPLILWLMWKEYRGKVKAGSKS